MTIDASGEYWKGTEAADLKPFLVDYEAGGYPVAEVVPAACTCGGGRFEVALSGDEQAVRRRCVSCGEEKLMLDSAEHWDDEDEDECACPCEGEVFEAAVGLARREDASIKWVSVGLRCVECGVLGVYADWKIDYSPSEHLVKQV
ncbi:MAG: hypothetical protein EOO75_16025 [Myxococcales bacterium]|nr:MAG: hypothetical protein EOO75_16025 [Myxococcales bacterium]